ncbi:YlaH-like family protein [Desmospora profundinema]|uniref:Membrane protein YccC n=1 Tax=Desmospora profundinema TaxID=1571184 RepID=A0ABU1IJ99_9BACL|nr:YlaH-like family protein [Desmospora profundinema]MDR6224852.1 putative membrane protein YccC [Desmospora profundinema]
MESIHDFLRQTPWAGYLTILVLTATVYKIAFARKLPILKSLVVYIVLALGCILFWLMYILLFPILEILLVTLVLIAAARIRMAMGNRKTQPEKGE